MAEYQYDFLIAGISLRWTVDFPLELDERYQNFRQELEREPDVICEIRIGYPNREPVKERPLYKEARYQVTEDSDCRYRIYPCSTKHPEQVITLKRRKDNADYWQLYIIEKARQNFVRTKSWTFYMAFEEMFYERGRILLHSSYVETKKGAVLFTGPSGIGKSTQADLWEQYGDGAVMNGDRTVLYEQNGCLLAAGSPYAGSSMIYRNYQSKIRAIIVLSQGEENRIEKMKGKDCLKPLMQESTYPYMTEEMRRRQIELLFAVAERIPMYRYCCRKDQSAVEALQTAFDRDGI